jgi:hypothetical protein
MSAAACPIAATFTGADSVGAAPASESPAATTSAITIERIQSLLRSPTSATLAGRRDLINRLVDAGMRTLDASMAPWPPSIPGRATHACGSLRRKRSLTTLALEHGPFRRDRSTLWKIVEWHMLSAANRDTRSPARVEGITA